MTRRDLRSICISPDQTVRAAMKCMNKNNCGIVLVVDDERHLIGTITDGDIRRAMLANICPEETIKQILEKKENPSHPSPTTAPLGVDKKTLIALMHEKVVRQIPILDSEQKVVDLVLLDDLVTTPDTNLQVLIMAGGYGTRLFPLTKEIPKPMLPIRGKPLMERMIRQIRDSGIKDVKISTHYLSDKITDYFGNGESYGVNISYVNEKSPLGTAGAIGLIESRDEPILVINGDILTEVNFRSMEEYHRERKADLTVGVIQYDINIPYGVIQSDGEVITQIQEKPTYTYLVNAGIYLVCPSEINNIPPGSPFTMTELIQKLINIGKNVVSFPIFEYWIDIGNTDDYKKVQGFVENE